METPGPDPQRYVGYSRWLTVMSAVVLFAWMFGVEVEIKTLNLLGNELGLKNPPPPYAVSAFVALVWLYFLLRSVHFVRLARAETISTIFGQEVDRFLERHWVAFRQDALEGFMSQLRARGMGRARFVEDVPEPSEKPDGASYLVSVVSLYGLDDHRFKFQLQTDVALGPNDQRPVSRMLSGERGPKIVIENYKEGGVVSLPEFHTVEPPVALVATAGAVAAIRMATVRFEAVEYALPFWLAIPAGFLLLGSVIRYLVFQIGSLAS